MKFDVQLRAKETEFTITVDSASPQLAAAGADRNYGLGHDVVSVEGVPCLGKCERCERFVLETERYTPSEDGTILCYLCTRETASA